MKELGGTNGLSRRDFLRSGLVFGVGAQALASGYAAVPDVFARAVLSAKSAAVQNDKVLVMIQLGGGNDGLQTVIPISSSQYRDFRPQLSAAAAKAQPISKDLGLHENLKGIKALYDAGKVAIVQGVGYTNPSFSHFDSIRVWETADPARRQQDGWLGSAIAKNYDSAGHPLVGCACGTTNVPGMLRDLQATLTVIDDVKTFGFQGGQNVEDVMGTLYKSTPGIYGALFDTAMTTVHYTELGRHDSLMNYLDSAITAFHDDLTAYGMADRVMIATWSEFGRRPKENASGGTDHGTASPIFLIGDGVKGGLYGETPNLAKLDQLGNLSYAVDFRAVYQEILASHLGVDAKEILGQSFERVPFVKAPA